MNSNVENQLLSILDKYKKSFSAKVYLEENNDYDVLMNVFGISPDLKRENRQYWGSELGRCWHLLVCKLFEIHCQTYEPALKDGKDELCDCIVGKEAIEIKYRIGSGDSSFAKKAKQYGKKLIKMNYIPIVLIVREDNLPAVITACKNGGWNVLTGTETFQYILNKTGFDLYSWLENLKNEESLNIER